MNNQYGAIALIHCAQVFSERKLKIFMFVKHETKATAHSTPDEVIGFTDLLMKISAKSSYMYFVNFCMKGVPSLLF